MGSLSSFESFPWYANVCVYIYIVNVLTVRASSTEAVHVCAGFWARDCQVGWQGPSMGLSFNGTWPYLVSARTLNTYKSRSSTEPEAVAEKEGKSTAEVRCLQAEFTLGSLPLWVSHWPKGAPATLGTDIMLQDPALVPNQLATLVPTFDPAACGSSGLPTRFVSSLRDYGSHWNSSKTQTTPDRIFLILRWLRAASPDSRGHHRRWFLGTLVATLTPEWTPERRSDEDGALVTEFQASAVQALQDNSDLVLAHTTYVEA